jgi:hypothetical protein
VQAFDDFVAKPLAANLTRLHGRDLAKRNPMVFGDGGFALHDTAIGRTDTG